jgi:hypothetical protein
MHKFFRINAKFNPFNNPQFYQDVDLKRYLHRHDHVDLLNYVQCREDEKNLPIIINRRTILVMRTFYREMKEIINEKRRPKPQPLTCITWLNDQARLTALQEGWITTQLPWRNKVNDVFTQDKMEELCKHFEDVVQKEHMHRQKQKAAKNSARKQFLIRKARERYGIRVVDN